MTGGNHGVQGCRGGLSRQASMWRRWLPSGLAACLPLCAPLHTAVSLELWLTASQVCWNSAASTPSPFLSYMCLSDCVGVCACWNAAASIPSPFLYWSTCDCVGVCACAWCLLCSSMCSATTVAAQVTGRHHINLKSVDSGVQSVCLSSVCTCMSMLLSVPVSRRLA